jgi:hypothetical protein
MISGDQHATGLTDCGRCEPRARPVRGAKVERDPGNADCCVGARSLNAEKARPDCEGRSLDHRPLSGLKTSDINDL